MTVVQTFFGLFDTARISVPTALEGFWGGLTAEKCDARLRWWSDKLLRDARIDLTVHGEEHLPRSDEPLIVMSNHQSLYDIPVLYRVIPGRLRMVAKKELFEVPVWGRAMRQAGFICVDRGDREQAVASLVEGSAQLKAGTKIWIAPEGTRSPSGELGRFKSGGFRMAIATGARIVPVAIEGTRHILRPHDYMVHRDKRVVVTIAAPVDPSHYGVERRADLVAVVRQAIARGLGQAA